MNCVFQDANWSIAFWTMLLVLATFVLALVAGVQLNSLKRSTQIDTILKLRDEFFSDDMNNYFKLIDNDLISYNEEYEDFDLKNRSNLLIDIKKFKDNFITTYDLDNAILGHIEDFGLLVKTKIIKFDLIYHFFDVYIRSCGNNKEIMKYINFEREYDSDVYNNFLYIYNKCINVENNKPEAKKRHEPKQRTAKIHITTV